MVVEEVIRDVAIILAISVGALLLFHRLRLPSLVGFILAGILMGPHGLGLVPATEEVQVLAEVGVILLLFAIGLEFSFKSVTAARGPSVATGLWQILVTVGLAAIVARWYGLQAGPAVFIGFLVALSSTAVVLKLLSDRGETDTPHGRTAVIILILQDLAIVPMMLFVPVLAGAAADPVRDLLILVAKTAVLIAGVYVSARWIVPKLLFEVARTRSRELFLLVVVALALGVAWLTSLAGLSLALGAFLAGLVLGQSEYGRDALARVAPLRDVFASFFFVSIGMLFDVGYVVEQAVLVFAVVGGVVAVKVIITALGVLIVGFSARTAVLAGFSLGQVGEFAFILSVEGLAVGLITLADYQLFVATAVITMAITPLLMAVARPLASATRRLPWSGLAGARRDARLEEDKGIPRRDHLIVVGYGINGRHVAQTARRAEIPYVILETNPESVRSARDDGEPIVWGDATHEAVLEHVGVDKARLLVVAISDAAATRGAVETAHRVNPELDIIARARFFVEIEPLSELGATEVVSQEFETSVELVARVLQRFLVPQADVDRFISRIREDGYRMLRDPGTERRFDLKRALADVDVRVVRIGPKSPFVDRTLQEAALRRAYGVTVLAVRHSGQTTTNPTGEETLHADDVLLLIGKPAALDAAQKALAPEDEAD